MSREAVRMGLEFGTKVRVSIQLETEFPTQGKLMSRVTSNEIHPQCSEEGMFMT